MATPLAYTAHYTHSAAAVRAAFADEQYWKDRIAEVGGLDARLDAFNADGDRIRAEMVQTIPADELPSAVTAVKPAGLVIPRIETYDGDSGVFEAHVEGAPAKATGTVVLTPGDGSSVAQISGSVEVTIPLFGKKIEAVVAEKLVELLAAETEFTNNWISERGGAV